MKNILVLTDFSETADHALNYACKLCNEKHIDNLFILNSYEVIPLYDSGEAGSLALTMQQVAELEQARDEAFKNLKERITPVLHHTKTISLLVNGSLVNAVNNVCEENNIDLIIMGVKVKDELEEVFFGSHINKIIEKVHQPVMVVPRGAPLTHPAKAILATDFSELKDGEALTKLKQLIGNFNLAVTGLHKLNKDENESQLNPLVEKLKTHLNAPHFEMVFANENADIPVEINETAKAKEASLIITIHKTRGFFASLFHRSVTKAIAWNSDLPVLVLHVK